ncbi:MAG: hypothetical protein GY798_10390 [Hyphomicrobiales bacterium]|nr:hypothetical protein [Hyphomicrobiales bacterium]
MASKKTLNAKNLEALGAERLAELLIDLSSGDATAKRRLRMEMVAATSPGDLAKEVRKRLATIGRSRSFVDWRRLGELADDLDTQRRAIVDTIAKTDPNEAVDLLWKFMALAPSIYERCDDSNGMIGDVFHHACKNLGDVGREASLEPERLADQVFDALLMDDYGQFDNLIPGLATALGHQGLEHLKQRMIDLSSRSVEKPADEDRVAVGWSQSGPIYEDEMAERARASAVRSALMAVADAQGDVDAFVDQFDEEARKVPRIAAEIAQRFLAAGRPQDAWQAIEFAEHPRHSIGWLDYEWENARINVLEALGRTDDAQAARWACFERSLSSSHLRAYLKRLPDFEDVEAETKALDAVQGSHEVHSGLHFLISWPALDRAANLVIQRADEINGDHYGILSPAADALAEKYPLAATLVLRAMIDFSLEKGRHSRYKHAARHLLECSSLASTIDDFGPFESHTTYTARLRRDHGRKSAFWSLIP